MTIQSICLFCGSNKGTRAAYEQAACELGRTLAQRDIALVYGGGNVGLMGIAADAALAAGGRVIGVIPGFLREKELAHQGLSELHVTQTMHERKALMEDLSGGFVALPGGFGTYDELFEMLTWGQLSVHSKSIGLLNVDGFFDPLLAMIRHGVAEGFVAESNLQLFVVAATIDELLAKMNAYRPAPVNKWLSHDRI
ncbi:TIGR00730 family Rossman fold protein [Vogesella indigofera]|uniref:LOG family protein n=1 Tax=Vogesella indigofera TaxID=45465 RepID=UPI00234EA04D|nr:TIGR00730 family Rossman fold protein [Vogesella indigofera]MDC7700087.1 TIGR00730 family Rossman fold protein [Vogesella indigofera]